MAQVSLADIFSLELKREREDDIQPGDLVRTGPNLFPHYRVIATCGDKAWVRNLDTDVDALTTICRCRKIIAPADA